MCHMNCLAGDERVEQAWLAVQLILNQEGPDTMDTIYLTDYPFVTKLINSNYY